MSMSVDDRLRAYSALLDETAIVHIAESTRPALLPDEPRKPPSPRLVVVLVVAAALIVAGVVFLRPGSNPRSVTADTASTSTSSSVSASTSAQSAATLPGTQIGAGTWTDSAASPLSPREDPAVVWTGMEFLVWGGRQGDMLMSDGAAYDPVADTWRSITNNQWAWFGGAVTWTGTTMVVLAKNGGASYDPATDTWTELPRLPDGGGFVAASWTGSQIVGAMPTAGENDANVVGAATLTPGDTEWHVAPSSAMTAEAWVQYVPTAAGFIAWNGTRGTGISFDATTGIWTQMPTLLSGEWSVNDSTLAVAPGSGDIEAIVETSSPAAKFSTLSLLRNGSWQPGDPIDALDIGTAVAVTNSAGSPLLMFLGTGDGSSSKALLDIATGQLIGRWRQAGEATTAQGVAYNGKELFVWGGQMTDGIESPSPSPTTEHDTNTGQLWRPPTAAFPDNRVDVGCIDTSGAQTCSAEEWYDGAATGLVLRTGNVETKTLRSQQLADLLASHLPAYTISSATDWSESPTSCSILRVIEARASDGSSLSVGIWQLVAPGTFSVPHSKPFAFVPPDLYVSDSDSTGDRTVVKVLPDGTSIKLLALGPHTFGSDGWPTTTAPHQTDGPHPPPQSIADLSILANLIADQLVTSR